ncbi:hypothetical protein mvi_25050 [Methylobacterium indicum]|uniref:Uncharacterized protein n=1 Tax=Methylobacterium indicum TaxID=1775910 RepID=A0A8H8WTE8_9HYPH|nr:hypothetical protein mvi_25050 [Methylobacterium indicum]
MAHIGGAALAEAIDPVDMESMAVVEDGGRAVAPDELEQHGCLFFYLFGAPRGSDCAWRAARGPPAERVKSPQALNAPVRPRFRNLNGISVKITLTRAEGRL